MKNQFTKLCIIAILPLISFSQTGTTGINAAYRSTPDDVNRYSNGGDTYSFGVGNSGDDNLLFEDFYIPDGSGGSLFYAIESLSDTIKLRRVDNGGTTGERHIIFFEEASSPSSGSATFNLMPEYVATMEEALKSRFINRGSDNVFANTGANSNNIERLDYIFEDGITVPADNTSKGFVVLERNGNDNFHIAPITSLDASNDPDAYGTVIQAQPGDFGTSSIDIATDVLNGFNGNLFQTASLGNQTISGVFFSFADLGFSAGDTVYGYSLAGADTTTDATNFVSYLNPSFFPTNTNGGSEGGLDLVAGGALMSRAFIHNSTGWQSDPSGISDCSEIIIVSGGTATFTADTQIGKISVDNEASIEGTNTPINYNIDVCSEVEAISDFEANNVNINFIDDGVQNEISGEGRASIDSVTVNNANGLLIGPRSQLGIKDALRLNNGTIITNGNLVFESNATETGMLSPLNGGNISGEVEVERFIKAKRAFRLVSSPLNTGTSIRENWQEGVNNTSFSNYALDNQNPKPGFGTHITGDLNGNNGFDAQPTGNPSLFGWNNVSQTWDSGISGTDGTGPTLNSADPYRLMVRGDRSVNITDNLTTPTETILRSRGIIQTGTQTLSGGFGSVEDDFNFFGNPYQAAVDMERVLDNTRTGTINVNENFIYVWDTNIGTRGGFSTIDVTDSTNNSPSTLNATKILQPGQAAFFTTASAGTAPSLEFQESDITTDEADDKPMVFSQNNDGSVYLELFHYSRYINGDTPQDAVRFVFSTGYSDDITPKDARQMGNLDENFAILSNQKVLTIEKRNLPQLGDNHQLYTNPMEHPNYMMTAVVQNIDSNLPVTLVDNYTETAVDLQPGFNEYSFQVDPNVPMSADSNRFNLVFDTVTLGTESNELDDSLSVFPNPVTDGNLTIKSPNLSDQAAEISIYDTLGKEVHRSSQKFDSGIIEINSLDLSAGVYFIQLNLENQNFRKKLIVK